MALPNSVTRTLVMKPEVTKIFDDLEAWLDHCRFELIDFNPAHLYKSREYREWARFNNRTEKKPHRPNRTNKTKTSK